MSPWELLEAHGLEIERLNPITGIEDIRHLIQRQTQVSQSSEHNTFGEIHGYGDGKGFKSIKRSEQLDVGGRSI